MPDYSIIIPAYNESELISLTLNKVFEAMRDVDMTGEVIVVDNNSSDDTADIAKAMGVSVQFEPVNSIAKARNCGGEKAKGNYLIFLDADTELNQALLKQALNNLQGGTICIGGSSLYVPKSSSKGVQTIFRSWNFISDKMNWAAGCFLYCTKEVFNAISGFDERIYASEEIHFVNSAKKWGKKRAQSFSLIKTYPIKTSLRKVEWHSFTTLFLTFFLFAFFPFATRFKFMCYFWYKRPV